MPKPPATTAKNDEIDWSHVVTIQTARDVLATTFLHRARRGESEIAALFDDGSALSWRIQNDDVSQIEERELLAPLRPMPTLGVCGNSEIWTARDNVLTMRSLDCATSSTRCCEHSFASAICRLASSPETAQRESAQPKTARVAVATLDGQVHLLEFAGDEIARLWSVDTLSGVTALALAGDTEKNAIGHDNGHLALHNRHNTRDCWTTDTQSLWVANAAFSPNSHALAIVDCKGNLQIRAAQNSATLQKIALDFTPDCLHFFDDNRHLVAVDAQQFSLIDSWTGRTMNQTMKIQSEETATNSSARVCGASVGNMFAVCAARELQLWRFESAANPER